MGIKDQVSDVISEALVPTAFIENLQVQVTKVKKKLADYTQHTEFIKSSALHEAEAKEAYRWVTMLKSSHPTIVAEIDRLKGKLVELKKELQAVSEAIQSEETKLQNLPDVIQKLD